VEQCWEYLGSLDQHPAFPNESQFMQSKMCSFSVGFNKFVCDPELRALAEASGCAREMADDAAFSRLRPIQDGQDHWQVIEEHRSGADTASGGSAPG
jgi:hypothetical protein